VLLGRAEDRAGRLENALKTVLLDSLLDVRRAAFSPEIGCRYTESIRAEIANACRRLEDHVRAALEA
jgi:hypothetical protein